MYEETLRKAALRRLKNKNKSSRSIASEVKVPESFFEEKRDNKIDEADKAISSLASNINNEIKEAVKNNEDQEVIDKLIKRYQRVKKRE